MKALLLFLLLTNNTTLIPLKKQQTPYVIIDQLSLDKFNSVQDTVFPNKLPKLVLILKNTQSLVVESESDKCKLITACRKYNIHTVCIYYNNKRDSVLSDIIDNIILEELNF